MLGLVKLRQVCQVGLPYCLGYIKNKKNKYTN